MIFDVVIFFDAIGKITTSKVFFCRSSDVLVVINSKDIFDVLIFLTFDVLINQKDHFDVLKKMASRSSEIRRSDPLPYWGSSELDSFKKILRLFLKKALCDISVFYDFISKFVMLSSNDFNVEFERI